MSEYDDERDRQWDLDYVRAALIDGTAGTDLEAGGVSLRVSDLPLFDRSDDGRLRQAVRVWARTPGGQTDLTLRLLREETVVDRVVATVGPNPVSLHLMVPEVRAPEAFRVEAATGAGAPLDAEITVRPQRKWTVYLIHHSHLDIGYTDPQASVLAHQLAYLDAALDHVVATDDWPEESRFRWNVEVTWPLQQWLRVRPGALRDAFLRRVKEGRIEVNALSFSMHTEAYSLDELARQLRFADELRDRYGLEIVSAMQTDVPGAVPGLATLLTDAGIRYLAVAHNYAGRSVPHLVGGQALTRPFYWRAADGQRLLVWYTDTPNGVAYMEGNLAGLAADHRTALGSLPEYLNALAQRPYPYGKEAFGWSGMPAGVAVTKQPYPHDILHLRVQSVIADNAGPSLAPATIAREWNERWAYPQLRSATNREFFVAAAERLGDQLETYAGDWTDWWADGVGSAARPLGFNRRAQSDIRAAQTLHALADAVGDDPQPEVAAEVDRAYDDMALFDEHTWGAANPWQDRLAETSSGAIQWARKSAFAHDAYDRTRALLDAGLQRFASVAPAAEALGSFAVFNPSSWPRTDLLRVFVPESRIPTGLAFDLVDAATAAPVPHVVEPQPHAHFRPRGHWLSFVAQDVPPIGYARYDLVATRSPVSTGEAAPEAALPEAAAIENEHFRLEVDAPGGCVGRLLAKGTNRDLVDPGAPHGFNQYIYDRYVTAPGFNHLSGRVTANDLSLLGSRRRGRYGVVTARSSTAVWDRITTRIEGEGVEWVETTLTLPRGVPRLDVTNRLHKIATPDKESVFFSFPFAVPDPSFSSEITGGVATADSPRVPGSAHYFRAIRHWITLEHQSDPPIAWATQEAPLVQLGNIHIPYAPFPPTIPPTSAAPGTIYSWALNNLWDTNFPPQQGGEMTFRYAIATEAGLGAREIGLRTAAALTAPLLGVFAAPAGAGRDLPARGSFCAIDRPEVEISHLAPSRRGHHLAVFLASSAAAATEARVSFGLLPVARAWLGNFLEQSRQEVPVTENAVRVRVEPGALVTVSLDLDGR